MKLKSKDEITVKLVEKLEEYTSLNALSAVEQEFGGGGLADNFEEIKTLGEVNMLKWVLSITSDKKEKSHKEGCEVGDG